MGNHSAPAVTFSLPDSEVEAEQTDDYYVLEADIGPTGGYLSLATTSASKVRSIILWGSER